MTRPANKTEIAALERVFAAEIENRLPFQSKARIYQKLLNAGLVEPMEKIFGVGTRFPVTVMGWQLTHAGRILYCSACE